MAISLIFVKKLRMYKPNWIWFLFWGMLLTIFACNPSRHLPQNQKLLVKQKVKVDDQSVSVDEVKSLLQQQPNEKFLSIWDLNLWVYQKTSKGALTPFKKWLRNAAGSPPSIFNSVLIEDSKKAITSYMQSKGFYNSRVNCKQQPHDKKIDLHWEVVSGKPYAIHEYNVVVEDSSLKSLLDTLPAASLVRKGMRFETKPLALERERVSSLIRDAGYYGFSPDYIVFEVDSMVGNHLVDLTMIIKNPVKTIVTPNGGSIVISDNHKRYLIGDIEVRSSMSTLTTENGSQVPISDTVLWHDNTNELDSLKQADLVFYYTDRYRVNPWAIAPGVAFRSGDSYNMTKVSQTYRALTGINFFRYVSIDFEPVDLSKTQSSTGTAELKCLINITKAPLNAGSLETDITNTGGNPGISGNINYLNRNIFRGGELLHFRLRGAMEVQTSLNGTNTSKVLGVFNTIETGAELNVEFPRFLSPFNLGALPMYLRPKTKLSSGFNMQLRPDYTRYITNVGFGYTWRPNNTVEHQYSVVDINSVKVFRTDDFNKLLAELDNPRLVSQYTDHLIMAMRYSFIFNNQEINRVKNYLFFRVDLESSGNLLYLADEIIKAPKTSEGYYSLFNIRYAQYLRGSMDFRYFWMLNKDNILALRLYGGLGKAYGNSEALPFEKGYYAGGANGMRGWGFKGLGPGSFSNPDGRNIDRMGDVQLEGNLEMRFPLYGFLKGALFLDVGNVWLLNNSTTFPGGTLRVDFLARELAADIGLGLRFSFDYFVFRLDGALPVHDPALPEANRWVLGKSSIGDVLWNFGIGYPF
jgi:outer membrane protein assembly factor BamA